MIIKRVNYHYEVYDDYNRFVVSADTMKEAEEEIAILEIKDIERLYQVTFLKAKARWITTKEGKRLQVPVEDFHPDFRNLIASSEQEAINRITITGYVLTNIHAV